MGFTKNMAVGVGRTREAWMRGLRLLKPARSGVGARLAAAILATTTVLAVLAAPAAHATKAPTATTGAASKVTIPAVTLNATVNPNGSATTYKFEYGPSEAYGSSIPVSPKSIGSGSTAVAASQTIGEIEAETVYHFRIVATNAFGTSYGKDETFAYLGDWTLESPPSPKAATVNYLSDVSCPSTSLCLAVGHSSANEGQSIGEVWSGGKWSLIATGKGRNPIDVSCPTTTVCWAVGTQGASNEVLVERYEYFEEEEEGEWWGSPYTKHKPIVPEGATNLRLNGISCTGALECTAVGYYEKEGKKRTLAERLTSSGWSVQSAPALTGAVLEDVSCTASNSCTAIGYQTISGYLEPLAERWSGSEWSTVALPAPELKEKEEWHRSQLGSISCASASSCVAVGFLENEEAERFAIAPIYDGSKFSSSALPKLKAGSTLEAVSCASSTSCLATGQNATGAAALALAYNGKEWATQAALTPEGKTAWLSGVACPQTSVCTAVGKATGGGETVTLAERVGGSWTLESPPSPKAATVNYLSDVSCPSTSLCLAVGHSSANEGQSIGEVWSGGKWSLIATGKGRNPIDVSCPTTTVCWAVGTQGASNEVLVERYEYFEEEEEGEWWGSPYTKHKPIVPEGATNLRLNGISCTGALECTAVGYYEKEGKKRTLAERLTSSGWSVQSAPALTGAVLEDVSCTASNSCTAIGYQTASTYNRKSLAQRFNGSEWSTLAVQTPSPVTEEEKEEKWEYNWLTSVSCPSASDCLATGVNNDIEFSTSPLALAYGGKEFSSSALPKLKAGSNLEAVSCASSTSCLATGQNATGAAALALAYNGKEWASQAALTPEGKTAWLSGVACPEALMCMAVGKATGGGETVTLAERLERSPPSATTGAATSVLPEGATLGATVDPNGQATNYQFEYGTTTSYGAAVPAEPKSAGSGESAVAVSEPVTGLKEGTTYHFRVVAKSSDGSAVGKDSTFTTKTGPQSTIISPQPSYTAREEGPIEFESSRPGSTFKCGFDEGETPTKTCTSPYTPPEKLEAGSHIFVVAAKDSEGLEDPTPAMWTFDTAIYPTAPSIRKLASPEEGAKSGSHFTLRSEWNSLGENPDISSVAYQLKAPSWDAFKSIPSQYLRDEEGGHPDWAIEVEGDAPSSPPLFFDVKAYAEAEKWPPVVEGLQLRAVFNGDLSDAGASQPVSATYTRFAGGPGDTVEQIGPASVDLVTGAFTITRTDVSIPVPGSEANLEFTRTYSSAYGASEKTNSKTLGQQWQPSAPVEAEYEEEAWQKLLVRHEAKVPAVFKPECWNEAGHEVTCGPSNSPCDEAHFCEEYEYEAEIPEQNWVEVLDNEGAGISFERTGSSPTYTYIPPEEAKEFALSQAGGSFILADVNGTRTEFTQNGSTSEYVPSKVSYAGSTSQARLTYGISEGKKRLTSAVGPAPTGVTCNSLESEESGKNYAPKTKGCRSLYFDYINSSVVTEIGIPEQRLGQITYYDSTGSGTGQVVARYDYDKATGNLTEVWDPRITKPLKESYAYEATKGARLASLTPAGQEPWQFAYYPAGAGGDYEAKLKSISRASLLKAGPSTATTTIAYDVPITGGEAPYDLGISAISKWGQSDYPVDATAIFPPTEVPSEEPSDYDEAAIHYMEPSGHRVNTASPSPPGVEGDSITTIETDIHGNVVRQLSAQNRIWALQAKDSVTRAQELDSHSLYNDDGTRMLESWGPLHEVRLQDGKTTQARQHTTVEYDKGAPDPKPGETWPNLPTREAVGAAIPGVTGDKDVQVSETAYEWSLRRPTEQITDPGGLNLVSKTVYNAAGQVIQQRQPSDTGGTGAGTTKTIYWTAGTNSEQSSCGNAPAWAGLPCMVRLAADPNPAENNPKLPQTRFAKYSVLDQPLTVDEEVTGSVKRTTTTTYDSAGRPVKTEMSGQGTAIPPVETLYDEYTGQPISQHFVCEEAECAKFDIQETRTTYDKLGRPVKYLDADGSESEVGYDLMGRPVLVFDGKGLQAINYDEESGLATKLTDSAAGSFEASYDADGKMTEQLLPNALAQQITYDEAGTAVGLRYEKEETFCSSACTWLDFSREYSIGGKVLHQESTLSTQDYGYDAAGRLTLVKDTEEGKCKTRAYAFDKNSNRTSKTAYGPEEGGGCSTETAATKQTYSYDSADRLIGDGVQYDDLGRITTLPTRYAGPQETWLIGGQTLPELKIESATFASYGNLVLTFPTWLVKLECEVEAQGKISAEEAIEESFTPYACALYKIEGGLKGKKLSCGTIKASISPYKGTASGMLISLDFENEMACLGDMLLPVSSFQHEFTDEEASKLPVKTKGKATFGAHTVEISGSSTWMLSGSKAGQKLAFKTTGPVTNQGELTTSYYVNDLTHSQSQGAITNTYGLDASLRQRERVTSGGSEAGTQIYHYSGGSDSPAWVEDGEEWTRNIAALGGSLGAIETSSGEVTLQLADMHGDVVATADIDPEATELLSTQQFDEYGNPKAEGFLSGGDAEIGWLGSKPRRTQLPSGVIQMGVRSYVPVLGRFLSADPVRGGSANAYEYAAGDPVNNFDLTGERCTGSKKWVAECKRKKDQAYRRDRRMVNKANKRGRLSINTTEGGLKALLRKPLLLESMKNKVHRWKVEDLRRLRRAAATGAGDSGASGESLCDSASKAGTVVGTAGLTAEVIPGGQGIGFVLGGIGGALGITVWIAC
jgi:RHS repeat-associated protein